MTTGHTASAAMQEAMSGFMLAAHVDAMSHFLEAILLISQIPGLLLQLEALPILYSEI